MWSAGSSLYHCFGGSCRSQYRNGIKIMGYEMDGRGLTLVSRVSLVKTHYPYSRCDPHSPLYKTSDGPQHVRVGAEKIKPS